MSDTVRQTWPPAAVDLLRVCFAAGRTASQTRTALAEVGFDFTRNAVIGKMHRLGLSSGRVVTVAPASDARPPKARRPRAAKADAPPAVIAAAPAAAPVRPVVDPNLLRGFLAFRAGRASRAVVPVGGYPFAKAPRGSCVWPLSGAGDSLRVCGCKCAAGGPYCEAHRKDAYQPAKRINPYIPGDRAITRPPREESPVADLCMLMGEGE